MPQYQNCPNHGSSKNSSSNIRTCLSHKLFAVTIGALLSLILYFAVASQSTVFNMLPMRALSTFDTSITNPFRKKIVHFDLKGAPPRIEYYMQLFPLLKALHVNAVLMEYEDMFPYQDNLAVLRNPISYSITDIRAIIMAAEANNLKVIPLVQTFGHLEFLLKHREFEDLREDVMYINTICPSDAESWHIITSMLTQVRNLHPNSKQIHIGADEASVIGVDKRCQRRLIDHFDWNKERLKLEYISRIATFARNNLQFEEVFAWNDMFDKTNESILNEFNMGKLIVPVIWGYQTNVTTMGYFPLGMFHRYSMVFPKMYFGSAFKGANGINEAFIDIERYHQNHESYLQLYEQQAASLKGKIDGIVLTGWQRYSHFEKLCEILPVAIPSLVTDLIWLQNVTASKLDVLKKTLEFLNCDYNTQRLSSNETSEYPFWAEQLFTKCDFPGSKIYNQMEKLRMLRWQLSLEPITDDRHAFESHEKDVNSIKAQLRNDLAPLFYQPSINEIIETQVEKSQILELI